VAFDLIDRLHVNSVKIQHQRQT